MVEPDPALAQALARCDASAPWWAAHRPRLEALRHAVQGGASAAQALEHLRLAQPAQGRAACLPCFVPMDALPPGTAYECFIHAQGRVPTRDNLHDLLNGLVWLGFPRTKARLNALQAQAIARDGIGARRGPMRDALTVFDENGALLSAPVALWRALRAREWRHAFVDLRPCWGQARLVVFGHALLEKLGAPRKGLTAHVLCAPGDDPSIDPGSDPGICAALDAAHLAAKPFVPLPLLGVPGWWPANAAPAFYDDPAVFRPAAFSGKARPAGAAR